MENLEEDGFEIAGIGGRLCIQSPRIPTGGIPGPLAGPVSELAGQTRRPGPDVIKKIRQAGYAGSQRHGGQGFQGSKAVRQIRQQGKNEHVYK